MNLIKIAKNTIFFIVTSIYDVLKYPIKTDKKTILFISHLGRGYNCNPKYIHKALLEDPRFKDFNFVWAMKDKSEKIEGATVIQYRSLEYFYYLAKSKFWISNCKLPEYCSKKKNQIYIQTWHGTPLKRLAHDINVNSDTTFYRSKITREEMTKSYDIDVSRYNYLISPNKFSTEKFTSCFKIQPEKIKEFGYPRNDFLVNLNNETIEELKIKFNLPRDKKFILYAPTWRDNCFNNKGYILNLKLNFSKWKSELGDDFAIIYKPHYLISNKLDKTGLEDFVFDFYEKLDINELYAVSDALITDYSSVFFDYSLLGRPIYFYMYDIADYKDNLRGFYLDINKDLPGEIYTDEDTLINAIKIDDLKANPKLKAFSKKFNSLESGDASKRIIEELIIPHL